MSAYWVGALRAWPLFLGYLPLGITYGVIARNERLSLLVTVLMSGLVLGGAAQVVVLQLLGAGSSVWAMWAATFFINLRFFVMSAALAPYMAGVRKRWRALLAWPITDEPYALAISEFRTNGMSVRFLAGTQTVALTSWILTSAIGYYAGTLLSESVADTVSFALPILWVALLVMQLERPLDLTIAAVAGALAIAGGGLGGWFVLASLGGAAIGTLTDTWKRRRTS